MAPLPIIIPVFQMIAEKAPTNSPVGGPLPRHDPWHDPATHGKEMQPSGGDGIHEATKQSDGAIAIDIDAQPTLEGNVPGPKAGNDTEFECPRLSPNHGRKDTRFRSFPSISTWSSRSSFSVTRPSGIRSALQKFWAFVLQNGGRYTEDEFIPNYRWLPILSGITIPFAILLQIPGLTERWYVRTANNQTIDSRPNPSILLAGNIVAMAAALFANICLIIRFLEKRVKQMTIVALCLLSVHDVINAVTVTVFGVEHRFSDGFTYGQPFWLVVASTVVSLFTTVTLIWDLSTTPDFSKSGSGLTRKQRSLVIIVMILLCWITLGGLVFSFLMQLSFIDGLYFTVVSIETIGFGDIHPNSIASRVFSTIYISVGVLNIALAISTARETIIESFEHSYRRRSREVAVRRSEYKRHRANERAKKHAIERMLRNAGLPLYIPDPQRPTKMKLNERALTPAQLAAAVQEATRLTSKRSQSVADTAGGTRPPGTTFERTLSFDLNEDYSGQSYEENYNNFRMAILREEKREFAAKLAVAWIIFLTFWLIGAGIFSQTEKWAYGTSLYFCFVAFSTIGYGDFSPATPAGRSVFVVWALLGVGAMTILVSVLSEAYSSRYKNVLSKGSFERAVKNFRDRRAASPTSHARSRMRSPSMSRDVSPERTYTREHAKRDLEALPSELLSHAKTFHEHVYYFLNNGSEPPPQTLNKLLDDIAEGEHMDSRLKQEMMGDDGARKTLFMMSYEGALRKMIDTAEKAVALLARRDLIGSDRNGSGDGSTIVIHEPETNDVFGTTHSHQNHDARLRFDYEDQRYKRRGPHIHPQGLVSEPDLHISS